MNTIEFDYGGKTLHLYMNGEAMFAIDALDEASAEDSPEILDLIALNTQDGITALCKVAAILAQQGECCRRYLQYAPARVPDAQELQLLLTPMQLLSLRAAVYRTVSSGYGTAGEDGDCDIDTGLAELEKKTRF